MEPRAARAEKGCPVELQLASGRVLSHAPDDESRRTSAWVFCRSSICRSVADAHCTHSASNPDQPVIAPAKSRAVSGTRRCRTHLAWCDGHVSKFHWCVLISPWSGCGQCSPPPDRVDIRDARVAGSTRFLGPSECATTKRPALQRREERDR